jgi:hypothetical protein
MQRRFLGLAFGCYCYLRFHAVTGFVPTIADFPLLLLLTLRSCLPTQSESFLIFDIGLLVTLILLVFLVRNPAQVLCTLL